MSFPLGSQMPPQPSPQSELCLRYPENVGVHAQISFEQAIVLLAQVADLAQRVPFAWSYIDKPPDGQAYVIFILPSAQTQMPPDGIRWLDQEKMYKLPPHNGRELEVSELKWGFAPNSEATASRVRRRFRLSKGGNPQLMLVHYLRGDSIAVPANLASVPIRSYPLRPSNEPRVMVAGERMGHRVPQTAPASHPTPSSSHPTHPTHTNGVGMSTGIGLGLGPHVHPHTAIVYQHTQIMDAMAREAARDRRNGPAVSSLASSAIKSQPQDEDESGDEYDNVSTRTLAIGRFKRNHELMAEVFMYASQGHRKLSPQPSPYASLNVDEMNSKMAKLTAEVDALKAKAEERRTTREALDTLNDAEQRDSTVIGAVGT